MVYGVMLTDGMELSTQKNSPTSFLNIMKVNKNLITDDKEIYVEQTEEVSLGHSVIRFVFCNIKVPKVHVTYYLWSPFVATVDDDVSCSLDDQLFTNLPPLEVIYLVTVSWYEG